MFGAPPMTPLSYSDFKIFPNLTNAYLRDFISSVKGFQSLWNTNVYYYDHPGYKTSSLEWVEHDMLRQGHPQVDVAALWEELKLKYYTERAENILTKINDSTKKPTGVLSNDLMKFMNDNEPCIPDEYEVVLKQKGSNATNNSITDNKEKLKLLTDAVASVEEDIRQLQQATRELQAERKRQEKVATAKLDFQYELDKEVALTTRWEAIRKSGETQLEVPPNWGKIQQDATVKSLAQDPEVAAVKADLFSRMKEPVPQASANPPKPIGTNNNAQNTTTNQLPTLFGNNTIETQKLIEVDHQDMKKRQESIDFPQKLQVDRQRIEKEHLAQEIVKSLAQEPDVAAVRKDLFSKLMEPVPQPSVKPTQEQKINDNAQNTITNVDNSVIKAAALNEKNLQLAKQQAEDLKLLQEIEEKQLQNQQSAQKIAEKTRLVNDSCEKLSEQEVRQTTFMNKQLEQIEQEIGEKLHLSQQTAQKIAEEPSKLSDYCTTQAEQKARLAALLNEQFELLQARLFAPNTDKKLEKAKFASFAQGHVHALLQQEQQMVAPNMLRASIPAEQFCASPLVSNPPNTYDIRNEGTENSPIETLELAHKIIQGKTAPVKESTTSWDKHSDKEDGEISDSDKEDGEVSDSESDDDEQLSTVEWFNKQELLKSTAQGYETSVTGVHAQPGSDYFTADICYGDAGPIGIHASHMVHATEWNDKYRQQQRDMDNAMIRNMEEDLKKIGEGETVKIDKEMGKNKSAEISMGNNPVPEEAKQEVVAEAEKIKRAWFDKDNYKSGSESSDGSSISWSDVDAGEEQGNRCSSSSYESDSDFSYSDETEETD